MDGDIERMPPVVPPMRSVRSFAMESPRPVEFLAVATV